MPSIALVLVSISICVVLAVPPEIVVQNLKLFVNGKEYIVQGFNYQPAPIGYLTKKGLCSYRMTPWLNGTQSACYDSDYFDGSLTPYRTPTPGPVRGWFRDMWERDLPQMKLTGANTIRLFNVNPTTLEATINVVNTQPGLYNITSPLGKEHISFLDYAASQGFMVMWPLFSDANALRTYPISQLQWLLRQQIDEVGNHSAVLMYQFGNEYALSTDWLYLFNISSQLIGYARDYQWARWGRHIPFTTALLDSTSTYLSAIEYYGSVVDIMSLNAGYRFTNCPHPNCAYSFTNLWSGSSTLLGWYNLSCSSGIPTLITEFNPMGYKNLLNASITIPTGFAQMWADLIGHIDQGAIGGLYFEWTDEPQKAGYSGTGQDHLGVMMPSVACNGTQCSNMTDVWIADKMTKRQWVYDSITTAVWNGKPYNWETDTFALLGRPQATLNNVPWICPGTPPPTSPPTSPPPATVAQSTTPPLTTGPLTTPASTTPAPTAAVATDVPTPMPSTSAPQNSILQTEAPSTSPTATHASDSRAPDVAASTGVSFTLPQIVLIVIAGALIITI